MKDSVYTYLRNERNVKAGDILWTTFKGRKGKIQGKGYSSSFLPCNSRATNDYKDRHNLAYTVNRYVNPMIERYFRQHGGQVDQNKYALCEMIQWIWRSAIREGEEIYIYIPSSRMRNLLIEWLKD